MRMRRILSALLVAISLLTSFRFCILGVSAEDAKSVYATTSVSAAQGSTYNICSVYLNDLTELSALTVSVYYDTAKITIQNSYNAVACQVYDSSNKDGCLQFSYLFDGKGTASKTRLFYFYYKVETTAEAGDTYFDILVSDAYDKELVAMNMVGSRCTFAITEKAVNKTCTISSSTSISTAVKEEFTLSYRLSSYQIASGSFGIQYDSELFEVVEVTKGAFLDNKVTDINTNLDGSLMISFVGTAYKSKYDLVTVTFRTLKNVTESTEIRLNVTELYDLDLNLITCKGCTSTIEVVFDETYTADSPSMFLSSSHNEDIGKISLTVNLEEDSHLGAGDFVLSFDADKLTYVESEKGFDPTFFNINEKNTPNGILKFSILSLSDITEQQTVLTVLFDAKQESGSQNTTFEIVGSGLTDAMTNPIMLNFVGTSMTIPEKASYAVSGNITSFVSGSDPITVTLIPEGQSEALYSQTITGNLTNYHFTNVPVGTYTLKVSKSNHLTFEECVTVTDADVTKAVELVLGNNGKQFKINSAYLVLTQDINVIYRTTLPDGFTNPRMEFLFNGDQTIVTEYTVDENGRYCYAFTDVFPQKMGDNICATLYATVNGVDVSVCIPNYSVRQYCINQLDKNPDDNLRRMISDLLVYGEKTQIYQNYKTDTLVTMGLDLRPSQFNSLGSEYNKQALIGEAVSEVRYSSARLELKSDMTVMLGITVADPTPYTFEVTTNGKTTVYTSEDLVWDSGRYYLSFKGVWATQYDDVITAVVKKDGVQVGQTLQYSVYTYIQKNQNTTDAKLCALLQAIYNYGESAKMYD